MHFPNRDFVGEFPTPLPRHHKGMKIPPDTVLFVGVDVTEGNPFGANPPACHFGTLFSRELNYIRDCVGWGKRFFVKFLEKQLLFANEAHNTR